MLFNFIQYFFSAPPLLRKISITTNPNLERNGADAIHYYSDGTNDIFILGESKCYKSKYTFNKAFKESVDSIVETFNNLDNELVLYLYEDFVDPSLEKVAKNFDLCHQKNTLKFIDINIIEIYNIFSHNPRVFGIIFAL